MAKRLMKENQRISLSVLMTSLTVIYFVMVIVADCRVSVFYIRYDDFDIHSTKCVIDCPAAVAIAEIADDNYSSKCVELVNSL